MKNIEKLGEIAWGPLKDHLGIRVGKYRIVPINDTRRQNFSNKLTETN